MIELHHICAGYGKKEILHDISTIFPGGTFTAIIGPNGCGKTTLLKTIAQILPATAGTVKADGEALSVMKPKESAKRLAYLSQGKNTPSMTVGELVLHGRFAHQSYPHIYSEKDKMIAIEAMACMGICHLAEEELSALSGGMRQNAYIAMALAQDADHILMDEPTTYLDIANRLQLMDTLRTLAAQGKGVVAVLHDLTLAMEYADQIAVMHHGKLLTNSTPDDVFASGIIDTVFGLPLKRFPAKSGYSYYFER